MIAAAYARYSTANQQETSIAAQLEGIRAYCELEGVQLCAMPYIDEARSGTNTDRPGFQRLLADARAGTFDAVVVYDISRGSRDVADWFMFRREMQSLGVRVLSATNALGDMDDPNAFLQELLSVGLGQHMVLQSRQKSIAGKRTEKRCHLKNIKADELDAYIINIVKTQILTEAVMEGAARRISATLATQSCLADDIRAELANLERKNRALTNLAVEVGLTPETKRQLLENEQHRQQLEARLASVAEPAPITEADILAMIRRDAETLECHPDSLREIVRHYVLSVTVFDTYINIVYAIDAQKQKNHPSVDANGCNIGQLPRCTPLILYTQKIPRPLLAAS